MSENVFSGIFLLENCHKKEYNLYIDFYLEDLFFMTGKTHVTAGMALTMLITQPSTIAETVMCLGIASIGSVISDVDVSTSKSRKNFNKILIIMTVSVILLALAEIIFKVGIFEKISGNSNIMRVIIGVMALIMICMFGKNCPHRSFMHSILGLALITISAYIILPEFALYMAISFTTHIFLDIFNKKKVKLFYPMKKPAIGLKLCSAGGLADSIIFRISGILLVAELILKIVSFLS